MTGIIGPRGWNPATVSHRFADSRSMNQFIREGRAVVPAACADKAGDANNTPGVARSIPISDAEIMSRQRSAEDDRRVVYHEIHHVVTGRIVSGAAIGGVTCEPGLDYSGLTWGPSYIHRAKFADTEEAPLLCKVVGALMPSLGESRAEVADIFLHVQNRCVELVAGSVGEELFLDGPAWIAHDDLRQARAYAGMICSSPASVEAFLDFCRVEAAALLTASAHIVHALAAELATRRTMDGAEVDLVIESAVAMKAHEYERSRRTDMATVVRSAADFAARLER